MRAARHGVGWLVLWAATFWLWFLLVGEWNRIELVAAAVAATLAASLGELARARAEVRPHVPLAWVLRAKSVVPMIFVDFGIVVWALVRSGLERKVVRGEFVSREFPAGGDDATSASIRAWAAVMATYSPNAYVLEIDEERQLTLVHDLVRYRRSEEPA